MLGDEGVALALYEWRESESDTARSVTDSLVGMPDLCDAATPASPEAGWPNTRLFQGMSENPTGRPPLVGNPPVRGRDMFGSPCRSVVRTLVRFELGCVWGPRQIGCSNYAASVLQAPLDTRTFRRSAAGFF